MLSQRIAIKTATEGTVMNIYVLTVLSVLYFVSSKKCCNQDCTSKSHKILKYTSISIILFAYILCMLLYMYILYIHMYDNNMYILYIHMYDIIQGVSLFVCLFIVWSWSSARKIIEWDKYSKGLVLNLSASTHCYLCHNCPIFFFNVCFFVCLFVF